MSGEDKVIADMVRDGAPAEAIERFMDDPEAPEDEPFGVWKENWPAFELFLTAGGCWVRAGMEGRLVAFDVAAAEIVWKRLRMKVRTEDFAKVMVLANVALDELSRPAGGAEQGGAP